jgi:hypothetical protein
MPKTFHGWCVMIAFLGAFFLPYLFVILTVHGCTPYEKTADETNWHRCMRQATDPIGRDDKCRDLQ